jgi:hypothetical protein
VEGEAPDACLSAGDWGPLVHEVKNTFDGGAYGVALASAYSQAFSEAQATTEEAEHLPPYKSLILIERIDNSS